MNSSYRVLKLQSGEELIAKIKGRNKGKIILDSPMVFKTTSRSDMFGQTKEITFLKDWLSNTSEDIIAIPENFIISWLKPSSNVTKLYDIERKLKTEDKLHDKLNPPTNPTSPIKQTPPAPPFDMDKLLEAFDAIDKDNGEDKPFFMHMMIPPDMVKDLFEQGLLDDIMDDELEDRIDAFYEEVNDHKYTGDDTNDPNYGNRWTDWNPDPNNDEYL
jgi:hypothetical protein|tara:strand:+ start:2461 stop:3108 length:648 start_codon:yes stop_codon:yes gene_type:complete